MRVTSFEEDTGDSYTDYWITQIGEELGRGAKDEGRNSQTAITTNRRMNTEGADGVRDFFCFTKLQTLKLV